ncbi:hypothetical protein [Shewanella cutis]|uniref:DUF3800 domain-containing protein n=1 Tax=Shewanella cutis TaxID=2766780 RepID=A0ABS9QUE9_9GAMM|nr:hypothetical protein [Shewanella sp. PS-2]MCG9963988.1 hypothetical protein [Shewanella sp. PS-2]
MIEIEFHCDEAGRLGYIDQPENYRGEFTLVAGIIVEKHNKSPISNFCDYLSNRFNQSNTNSKFHVTDLESNRESVRNEVFNLLKSNNIPIVYGANYFQALHLDFAKQKQINLDSVRKMKSQGIGLSKNLSMFKKNAQAEAFYNFYAKAMGISLEIFNQPILGLVKTDKIDSKVHEYYVESVDRFHSLNSRHPLKGRRYDYQTKEVDNFGVSVNLQIDDPKYRILFESRGEVEIIDSSVSILSDVVANSLNHHLLSYVKRSNCGALNGYEAIDGYPLADQIIVAGQKSMDLIYPYPVA